MGNNNIYDVAIIGAGPAGATLARLIGGGRRVLLIDPRDFSAPPGDMKEKCCGGLLAPDAQDMLSRLGLGLPREVLAGPQLFVVEAIDLDTKLSRYYPRHYINIDRRRFDHWLVSLVPPDVETRFGWRLVKYDLRENVFELRLSNGTDEDVVTSRMIVGADGAASCVRQIAYGKEGNIAKYVALQETFECGEMPPHFTSIFCRDVTDFYSWIIPKEGTLLVGSALKPGENPAEKFEVLKSRLIKRGVELGSCLNKSSALILRPDVFQICPGKNGVALIGEAAGLISPSSAEGISFALGSAAALADAIKNNGGDPLPAYKRKALKLIVSIGLKNLKSPFIYNPLLRRLMMSSGLSSMELFSAQLPQTESIRQEF